MNAQNDDFSEKIRHFLDECTKGFSPDLIEYLKTGFQTSAINGLVNKEMDLQIRIVVDTNVVIKSLRHYAKTGESSLLLKLESNPLFPLYSPTDLEDEVSDYIENKEKDPKNRPKMREMWSLIRTNITVQEKIRTESWNKAKEVIGKRDSDDVPFVGVYFDLNASGIVTDDEDYDQPEIRRFTIESLGNLVGNFHRGIFSFFIINDLGPPLFDFIKQVALSIIKFLAETIVQVFGFIKALATGGVSKIIELIDKIPSWLMVLFLGVLVIGGIAIISHDDTRKRAEDIVQHAKEKIRPVLDKIILFVKNLLAKLIKYAKKSAPYADMTMISIEELEENIQKLREEVETLLSEEILSSS